MISATFERLEKHCSKYGEIINNSLKAMIFTKQTCEVTQITDLY